MKVKLYVNNNDLIAFLKGGMTMQAKAENKHHPGCKVGEGFFNTQVEVDTNEVNLEICRDCGEKMCYAGVIVTRKPNVI